ncbi:hypothetical protein GCM10012288_20570 [Malaciobacter pacificus]|uniref:DUF4405 domain-containing membrane protein n=1 Tax=Malaciobacter pacificus TaxID=1080223 RepID=A0A5C2H9J8_9BACT|nr:DUF4405 domain-containing protein [Malaciobacter pacificus]QEP35617.1 DUF4405 domain-containing membrane protein [Malaciobacter pacificus]GGD46180.1 hypothetical protein GCM10012288_20570 [Malaciobacter pacificus]
MSLKKITSLTMLLAVLVMSFTGILLFITPPGRVANWTNWQIFGMSKSLIADIHTTFMVLFIVATILHIFYNLKPIVSYMKNQAREFVLFTKEMIVAATLVVVFLIGTIYQVAPFSTFIDFGDGIKNSWEKQTSTAPYSHAELSSLEEFILKMDYQEEEIEGILQINNISYKLEQSLSQIAKNNDISPNKLFEILQKQKNSTKKHIPLTGMGKKSVEDVASTLGVPVEEFIQDLEVIGIKASKNDKFKEVAESIDSSPVDLLRAMGYEKNE